MTWPAFQMGIACLVILVFLALPVYANDCGCGGSDPGDDGSSDSSDGGSSSGYGSGGDPAAFASMARDLHSQGLLDEALQAYNDSLALDPYNTPALMGKGDVFFSMQKYPDAVEAYLGVLAITPADDQAYFRLGNTYLIMEDFQAAADAYERSLSIYPGNTFAAENLKVSRLHLENPGITPSPTSPATTGPVPAVTPEHTYEVTELSSPPTQAAMPPTPHSSPGVGAGLCIMSLCILPAILHAGRRRD